MDCWTLVRAHRPDWPLDRWGPDDAARLGAIRDAEAAGGQWEQRWPPRHGDIVLRGVRGDLRHAGIAEGAGLVRHWHRRHGEIVQPLAMLWQLYSRIEAWAWRG